MSNPDSRKIHEATETQASNGHGTVRSVSDTETLDHPILDGASETYTEEGEQKNPRYGMEDPALIRDTETGERKTPPPWSDPDDDPDDDAA